MTICSHCQYENIDGALVCEQCNHNLWQDGEEGPTQILDEVAANAGIKSGWGTSTLAGATEIALHIEEEQTSLTTYPGDQLFIGRPDSANDFSPELDLTPYGAADKGVSRRHAVLFREDQSLTIVDLGSANGTYVNGKQLDADLPQILHDGDEIRLGTLAMYLYFK